MKHHTTATGLAGVLALASCAGAEQPETETSDRATSATPVQSELFHEPEWGINYSSTSNVEPVVLPEGVVVLNGTTVEMHGADGGSEWSTKIDMLTEDEVAGGGEGLPTLRMVDKDSVALVEVGKTSERRRVGNEYITRVHMLDVADGQRKTVEVAGSDADTAKLTPWGMGFDAPSGPDTTVSADGTRHQASPDRDLAGVLGGHPVFESGPEIADGTGGTRNVGLEVDGQWTTDEKSPLDEHTNVEVGAYSEDLALMRWSWTNPASLDDPKSQTQLVRISTGKVLDEHVPCAPVNPSEFRESPDGTSSVAGPVLVTEDDAKCVDGADLGRVNLQAVTNNGVAYGTADGKSVRVDTDGKITTARSGEADLIGMMKGDLAVHHDDGEVSVSKTR